MRPSDLFLSHAAGVMAANDVRILGIPPGGIQRRVLKP